METTTKFKTSNVAVCLKAIKDYIDMDAAAISKKEQSQLKERAKKAADHLSLLFSPEVENVYLDTCPAQKLPTIE